MCKDVKITAEQLNKAKDADYQKLVQQVTSAVKYLNKLPGCFADLKQEL